YYEPHFIELARLIGTEEFVSLNTIVSRMRYGASVAADYVSITEGIPFIRGNDLQPNNIQLHECVALSRKHRDAVKNNFLSSDQVLITRSGTVGVAAPVLERAAGFAFGSFMIALSLKGKWDPRF